MDFYHEYANPMQRGVAFYLYGHSTTPGLFTVYFEANRVDKGCVILKYEQPYTPAGELLEWRVTESRFIPTAGGLQSAMDEIMGLHLWTQRRASGYPMEDELTAARNEHYRTYRKGKR
jgi:hypothetical protein